MDNMKIDITHKLKHMDCEKCGKSDVKSIDELAGLGAWTCPHCGNEVSIHGGAATKKSQRR